MTLVRKLARNISSRVVRWASPGCKEWAEGLEREVAFIPSDWRALGWAIGSTRVLLDHHPAPFTSLAEVSNAAQRLVEQARSGYGMWMPLVQGPFYALEFFLHPPGWSHRAGCAVVVLGAVIAGINLLIDRHRLREPYKDDIYDDILACARFYRAELQRRRSTVWIQTFALLCWSVGSVLAARGDVHFHQVFGVAMGLLWVVATLLMAQSTRNTRRRIEQLDALLAENGEAGPTAPHR
jgi:hypothetical protein